MVGDTWSSSYTITCGTASPIAYLQTGTVVDVESIAVPAGTYTTLKLQSTLSWTDLKGTTHTESITNWRHVDSGISVQEKISITYSGTVPTHGHPVSSIKILQSQL